MNTSKVSQFFQKSSHEGLWLLLFFLAVYLLPLGVRPLLVPDEIRYAEVPREMVASGDWVVPRLNGMRYFEKPPLGYWLTAASLKTFGENNFAVRLPSVLAVGLTALLVGLFFRPLATRSGASKQPRNRAPTPTASNRYQPVAGSAAGLAGLVYLSCGAIFIIGTAAVLDNPLTLFLTATLIFFFWATECDPGSGRERIFLLLSGAACGLAFLTKGFIAFAVPVLTLATYLLWQHRWRDLWCMAGLPLLAAVLIALPWGVMIHQREPDFWHYFFWYEHIHRFFSTTAQHARPIYYFLLAAPIMLLPWSLLLPTITDRLTKNFRELPAGDQRRIRFALCWLLPLLFFSLSRGKLMTYILPCFPAFAILAGYGLNLALNHPHKVEKSLQRDLLAGLILFLLLLGGLSFSQFIAPANLRLYRHPLPALFTAGELIVAVFILWLARGQRPPRTRIILFALAPSLLLLSTNFLLPERILIRKAPGLLLRSTAAGIPPDSVIIADKRVIQAACWYLKRTDIYLLGGRGELKYGISYPDATARHLTNFAAVRQLIKKHPGSTFLVSRTRNLKAWLPYLPSPRTRTGNGPEGYTILQF